MRATASVPAAAADGRCGGLSADTTATRVRECATRFTGAQKHRKACTHTRCPVPTRFPVPHAPVPCCRRCARVCGRSVARRWQRRVRLRRLVEPDQLPSANQVQRFRDRQARGEERARQTESKRTRHAHNDCASIRPHTHACIVASPLVAVMSSMRRRSSSGPSAASGASGGPAAATTTPKKAQPAAPKAPARTPANASSQDSIANLQSSERRRAPARAATQFAAAATPIQKRAPTAAPKQTPKAKVRTRERRGGEQR